MKLSKKIIGFASIALIVGLAAIGYSQNELSELNNLIFRQTNPQVRYVGTLNFSDRSGTSLAQLTSAGAITMKRRVVSASSGTTVLTTAQSGALVLNTGTSSTTTFTLPAASNTGATYCFVEGGDAGGELLVGVATGDNVVGRGITDTSGTGGATAIATAASTGIKNTAATNVKGDMACLTADGGTTWYMTSVMGIWATR